MMTQISAAFDGYPQHLPKNIAQAATYSGLISFAISTVVLGSMEEGLADGVLAVTISLITSLTMPFFRKMLAVNKGEMKWTSYTLTQFANFGISQVLLSSLLGYRTELIAALFLNVFGTFFFHGLKDRPTNVSPIIIA